MTQARAEEGKAGWPLKVGEGRGKRNAEQEA